MTIRVLFVDDEEQLLNLAKTFLERMNGLSIDCSLSPREALSKIEEVEYDAIVSDYQMPDMNGIEFLKELRGRGYRTPFILFTGRGREDVAIDALNSGASFYLQKGGDPKAQFAELSNMIHACVERYALQKALEESERWHRMFLEKFKGIAYEAVGGHHELRRVRGAVADITGYDAEAFMSGSVVWSSLVLPEDMKSIEEEALSLSSSSKREAIYLYRIRRRDGGVRWIEDVASVVGCDERGQPIVQGIMRDVTEREIARGLTDQAKDQLGRVVRLANLGHLRYDVATGRVTWSEEMYRLFGIDPVRGEPEYADFAQMMSRLDWGRLDQAFMRAAKNGVDFDIELGIRRPNGSIRTVRASSQIKRDADGKIVRVNGTFEDVTPLRDSDALKVVMESSPVVLFVWQRKPGWPVSFVSDNVSPSLTVRRAR